MPSRIEWWQWDSETRVLKSDVAKSVSHEPQSELRALRSDAESGIYNKWHDDGIFPLCLSLKKENVPAVDPADIMNVGSVQYCCRKCQVSPQTLMIDRWKIRDDPSAQQLILFAGSESFAALHSGWDYTRAQPGIFSPSKTSSSLFVILQLYPCRRTPTRIYDFHHRK